MPRPNCLRCGRFMGPISALLFGLCAFCVEVEKGSFAQWGLQRTVTPTRNGEGV
jgi:hypothetical protein